MTQIYNDGCGFGCATLGGLILMIITTAGINSCIDTCFSKEPEIRPIYKIEKTEKEYQSLKNSKLNRYSLSR